MDDGEALTRLSRAHALALRLRAAGADDELIADCLEIPAQAIEPLLEIAAAKLANAAGMSAASVGGSAVVRRHLSPEGGT